MGKLLSLLSRDDNCCSSKSYDIFLDFENAAPSDLERDVYEDVERVLKDSDRILEDIQLYRVSFFLYTYFINYNQDKESMNILNK